MLGYQNSFNTPWHWLLGEWNTFLLRGSPYQTSQWPLVPYELGHYPLEGVDYHQDRKDKDQICMWPFTLREQVESNLDGKKLTLSITEPLELLTVRVEALQASTILLPTCEEYDEGWLTFFHNYHKWCLQNWTLKCVFISVMRGLHAATLL